jgi:hypothetical protein
MDEKTKGPGEITREMQTLEKSIAELRATIDILWERLAPVLRNEPVVEDEAQREGRTTPFGEEIARMNQKVYCATGKLKGILKRIEL